VILPLIKLNKNAIPSSEEIEERTKLSEDLKVVS